MLTFGSATYGFDTFVPSSTPLWKCMRELVFAKTGHSAIPVNKARTQ